MAQQVFTSSGTFTPAAGVTTVDVLVVGGGGSGGGNDANNGAGGGGGGAVVWAAGVTVTPGTPVTVTVGNGGAAVTGTGTDPVGQGNDGGTSTFASSSPVTAAGGGGGGRFASSNSAPKGEGRAGAGTGASGGGGGTSNSTGYLPAGGASGGGTGHAGGAGNGVTTISSRRGGGGGGAGAAGSTGATTGNGGAGVDQSANVGTSVGAAGWFGGGGGGGRQDGAQTAGVGGQGGGGTGGGMQGSTTNAPATSGGANTGGGGGGARTATQASGAGGSGIVVVVYTIAAPGVPTSVAAGSITTTSIDLSWSAPSSGGPVTSYDVRLNGGTPITGVTSPYTFTGLTPGTSYTLEVRAVGPGGTSSWVSASATTLEAPGVPTSVAATPTATDITLTWSAPTSGGTVTSYDVRIDGGTPVTGVSSPYTFTGLTGGTSYTVEVRAVGPGGTSSWVGVTVETLPGFTGEYRVRVTAGSHGVWEATSDDEPDLGVTLPLSFGWSIPENVDFFPNQANPLTGTFGLVVESMADVALQLHDPVLIEMWVPAAASVPWQRVVGVVSQMEVSVLPSGRKLVSVSFTDPSLLLASVTVGWDDWPQESVFDRVERICDEAGILTDWIHNESSMGTLPARTSNGPTTVLAALREALADDSDRNTSIDPDNPLYGRIVWSYHAQLATESIGTLFLRVLDRRYFHWPATEADGDLVRVAGEDGALDGCAVEVGGTWSRLPIDQPTYAVVDGLTFGTDLTIPYFRSTRFVDTSPDNPSATARTYLGRSLVPPDPGTYQATDWRSNTLTHLSHLDPDPVTGWFGTDPGGFDPVYASMPWAEGGIRAVIVEPVDSSLTLDGNTWILGTLTGARFTLPPGGHHYVEVTLRPDIYDTQLVD